jgi:hypothetical protein
MRESEEFYKSEVKAADERDIGYSVNLMHAQMLPC